LYQRPNLVTYVAKYITTGDVAQIRSLFPKETLEKDEKTLEDSQLLLRRLR